jgi:hypothetical protein
VEQMMKISLLHFLAIITPLLSLTPSPSLPWVLAPNDIIEKHLFPYEICLLQKHRLLDGKIGIFEQSNCEQDLGYQNISSRCKLGAIQQHMDGGLCHRESWGCSTLSQRTGSVSSLLSSSLSILLPMLPHFFLDQGSGNIFLIFPYPTGTVINSCGLLEKLVFIQYASWEIQ